VASGTFTGAPGGADQLACGRFALVDSGVFRHEWGGVSHASDSSQLASAALLDSRRKRDDAEPFGEAGALESRE